jgi:hypothetical protein
MHFSKKSLALVLLTVITLSPALTFGAKKYQVTGMVTELTDKTIVVQTVKSDERWEIERDAATKVTGDLKVGAKVTIEYRMVAADVDVK